jgi:SLIT-ROBO Rho GTPase activating protein
MKTYHAYHGDSQQAENKLLRVQSQRVKAEQPKTIGRRFGKDYEKESEKVLHPVFFVIY